MTDVKYTAVPVSDRNEKVDPNPQPEEQSEPRCPFRLFRGSCRRWRGDGEEPPNRRRWRIVRRIFLTLVLFYYISQALRAGFSQLIRRYGMQGSSYMVENLVDSPNPYFQGAEIYGAGPLQQDRFAQELFDEFHYIFASPESALDLDGYLPRSQAFNFPEDPLDYPEDELVFPFGHGQAPGFPSIPSTEDGNPPDFLLETDDSTAPYYRPDVVDFILSNDRPHPPHRKPPHRKHPHHCNNTDLIPWDGEKEFVFSPDDFQSFVVSLHGTGRPPAFVKIHQLDSDDLTEEITVKVSALVSSKKLNNLLTASAFDHEGTYIVEINVRDKPKHHGPKDCIKIKIDITFPAGLSNYGSLNLRLSGAVIKAHLEGIQFSSVNIGLGRGAILSKQINADNIRLGAVKGFLHGRFDVGTNFTASTISGFSPVYINPTGDFVHIKATTINGIASVKLVNAYEGHFALTTVWARSTIHAPDPSDIHIEKLTHNIKAGYYKSKTNNKIYISATHGHANLTFV
ncbi:hypothetical protein BC937DRAFT_93441 [Endogone sp. FLAS-F59071]|nr:hypothetical protein BC937DRAFT_93441 [Endogone sp. FLAS-F59071]|eukprot:RUS14708.1 hypothetical protein BC937DRAFT_93441 [Endogone sp. FLAS-F59071]